MIEIRDPTAADEVAWRCLWNGYLSFYETMVPEEVTAETWRRILDPKSGIFARLAVRKNRVIGFAVAMLHPGTWSATPVCYLEDLFVSTDVRGSGAGRALIEDLIAQGRESRMAEGLLADARGQCGGPPPLRQLRHCGWLRTIHGRAPLKSDAAEVAVRSGTSL